MAFTPGPDDRVLGDDCVRTVKQSRSSGGRVRARSSGPRYDLGRPDSFRQECPCCPGWGGALVEQVVVGGDGVVEARSGDKIDFAIISVVGVIGIVVVGLDPGSREGTDDGDEGTGAIGRGVRLRGVPHDDVVVARGKRGKGRGRSVNCSRIMFASLLLVVQEGHRTVCGFNVG